MIQSTELRIGNFFCSEISYMDGGGFSVDKVAELKTYNVVCNSTFSEFPYEEIYPIKLMPEILENCGFEKDKDGVYCLSMPDSNLSFYFIGFIQLAFRYAPIMNFTKCIHLHGFQNVYYYFTGKELEVNLNL